MSRARSSAGEVIPTDCRVIEVRVAELRQLFNAIDPSPFRERDLDPRAEEFIVEWARDFPRDGRLALLVHLERSAGHTDEAPMLAESIHQYFEGRAVDLRRRLRELFRRGRISLMIALGFLGASIAVGDVVASSLRNTRLAEVIREGLLIGGWVAMWRPLEVFLYDWWPIRAEAHLFDRLSTMPVRIEYKETAYTDAWRADWPAVSALDSRPLQAPGDHHGGFVRRRAMSSDDTEHQHTRDEERRIREAALDRTIEGSFPASDPPSSNPNPDDRTALEGQDSNEGQTDMARPDHVSETILENRWERGP
jgi:hypothetical protein